MVEYRIPAATDIHDAATRLTGISIRTPLIEHPALNEVAGGRVLLKAENLQRAGAFKFRGAYNAVSRVNSERFPGGVVACSSGNHAQGVAAAAGLCGLAAAVIMPKDAPTLKQHHTKALGAEVILYDRETEDRTAIASTLAAERKAAFIHPFDDPNVIAGQGTVGLELKQQASQIGVIPDTVLVCCSGGGLLSGVALAVKDAAPQTTVHPVEPESFEDFARSLSTGKRCLNARKSGSICDALLVEQPGELPFEIARKTCGAGYVVSDDEVCAAMRFAFHTLKLVIEPGGAVGLAAILARKCATRDRITACTISGGNIDLEQFSKILG